LYLRPMMLAMADRLNDLRETILDVSAEHIDTVMPCYTYLQHAQPTTLAHYLLSLSYSLDRDYERIIHAYKLTNMSPAGSAIQTGTSHPLNRQRVSKLMGFDAPIRNTRDAVMNYDYLSEILLSISLSVIDIAKMLEDFAIWHSMEFNMISLTDAWCGTSSVMPQKRNPYPFSTIRGKASKIFGRATQIFSTLEAPSLGSPSPIY
jgi:argininosuccinate lyase